VNNANALKKRRFSPDSFIFLFFLSIPEDTNFFGVKRLPVLLFLPGNRPVAKNQDITSGGRSTHHVAG
jgi:hypothetical protein